MGYFDSIIVDPRLKVTQWQKLRQFRSHLLAQGFARVYDLQMVDRTNFYFQGLLSPQRPEWCGTAWGCTYRYRPPVEKRHTLDHQRALLRLAGVDTVGIPDVRHLANPTLPVSLPLPYALLIPGASLAHTMKKCWTIEGYAAVARFLLARQLQPVIIGGPQEDNRALAALCPGIIDLTGQTSFRDIITLAAQATVAIGNDTGPLHLAAASHCPVIALFSGHTHPHLSGPRSPQTICIQEHDLKNLHPQTVIYHLEKFIPAP
jgi:ADP-heptose:LPS heptosyltransferase